MALKWHSTSQGFDSEYHGVQLPKVYLILHRNYRSKNKKTKYLWSIGLTRGSEISRGMAPTVELAKEAATTAMKEFAQAILKGLT